MQWRFYILPIVLIVSFFMLNYGVLHLNFLQIRSHELKLTHLDYRFIPGEVYYAGETVSSNNYEDANLSLLPDYTQLLQDDLKLISDARPDIDKIDAQELSYYSGSYQIKLCLDHKKITVLDSSLFKKTIYLDILGSYELWDSEGCDRLYVRDSHKFWIRDSIIVKGIAKDSFLQNKITEIWLGQMSLPAFELINQFERPYKSWDAFYIQLALKYRYLLGSIMDPKLNKKLLRREGKLLFKMGKPSSINENS